MAIPSDPLETIVLKDFNINIVYVLFKICSFF